MIESKMSRVVDFFSQYYNRLHSIAVQLFLLFFISIIIPVLIGGYLSFQKSAHMIEEQVSNVASLTIKQVSDNLNFFLKGLDNTSMRVLGNKAIQEALNTKNTATPYDSIKLNTEAKDFLVSLLTNMPEIMDIYVLDINQQNSVVSSPIQSVVKPWEMEWYKKILEADGRAVWFGMSDTSYLKGLDMGIPVFGLGRTVKDVDTGTITGVVFIEVNGKILSETLDDIQFGQTGYTYLVDRNNKFTYHRDHSYFGQSSDLILPKRTQVVKMNYGDMMIIPADLANDWRVAGIVPVQELVGSSIEIRDLTNWIALASTIVAIIIGYYVAHKIGRPLVYLSKLMKRGEVGDLTVRSNIMGKNEIGQLSRSFNEMIRQIDVLIKRIAEEESEKKKAEIRALRYQINPHFLYNTLNSIRWMAKLQRTEDVANAISTLVQLLEASLERNGTFVKLGEELDLLIKYMIIQEYRYNNGIILNINCPEGLKDTRVPRMLLQPIVENAIFHGIAPKEDKGTIMIKVYQEGINVVIVIKDDGIGIDKDKIPYVLTGSRSTRANGMTSIGLRHVHQTLQLYYGVQYGVSVESSEDQGTSVQLIFPIKEEDEHVQSAIGG